jgi:6-phosphofructokinase 1
VLKEVKMKRIGILTSGGDAPGMNACIRAAVRTGAASRVEIIGIKRGYTGLITNDMQSLSRNDVSNIIQTGGSILESSRCPEFEKMEGRKRAIENLAKSEVEGLILVGGDGTFRGGNLLSEESSISIIGVPGTIDNDVYGTDFTIGFDSAVNCAVEAIDRVRDTARTFERIFFVEVMGHHTGFIALQAGMAGGADSLVIPEYTLDIEDICQKLQKGHSLGKKSAIVVVAEAEKPGVSYQIAQEVSERTGFESRVCVLGHVQRGGSPTAADRVLATELGVTAVQALIDGIKGKMVGIVGGNITYTPLRDTWEKKKELNPRFRQLVQFLW